MVRLASKLSINIIDIILPCGVMFWCNTILLLAISNSSFSKCLLSFLNRKNIWRQEISERKLQPSERRWVQGVLSASCLHSILYITFLIMSGYEVYSAAQIQVLVTKHSINLFFSPFLTHQGGCIKCMRLTTLLLSLDLP